MIILEENFKWHLEAFASELFIYESHRTFDKCITAIDKSGETRT